MSHDDFAVEPVPGLPERLPDDETMLWQGAPEWTLLAWRVFHIREVAFYFAILFMWTAFSTWWVEGLVGKALFAGVTLVLPAAVAIALLALFAYLTARTTVYTLTSKRLVMRIGIALPTTFNMPFAAVQSAQVKLFADGSGYISVALTPENQIAFLVLWPHARPWHLRRVEPSLRAIAEAKRVADLLAQALGQAAGQSVVTAAAIDPSRGRSIAPESGSRGRQHLPQHPGLTVAR